MPEPVEPRKNAVPKWILAGAVVFLLCFGLGLGLVLGGGDDDSSDADEAASTDTVDDDEPETTEPSDGEDVSPEDLLDGEGGDSLQDMLDNLPEGWEDMLPEGLLDDLSDMGDLDDLELPDGMSSVQISVVFSPDANDRQVQAIQSEFEGSDLVGFVQFISAEDVSEITGMTLPEGFEFDTLTAFGTADADPDDTRDFACSFTDDPGVETVQVFGADPCGTTT
jgi:hypothetical protein